MTWKPAPLIMTIGHIYVQLCISMRSRDNCHRHKRKSASSAGVRWCSHPGCCGWLAGWLAGWLELSTAEVFMTVPYG
jgi:hypothetical protein